MTPLMEPREPQVENHGLYAFHDQRCAVLTGESAVIDCQTGIYQPSWKAQDMGWQLVRANTWWRRLCLRIGGMVNEWGEPQ